MVEEFYDLYKKCFKDKSITFDEFEERLDFDNANVLCNFDKEGLLNGFVVVRENHIGLLCVDPKDRNKGIGSLLLEQAEQMIEKNGYEKVYLGYKVNKKGVVDDFPAPYNKKHEFFRNKLYKNKSLTYDISIKIPDKEVIDNDFEIINTIESAASRIAIFRVLQYVDKNIYDKYLGDIYDIVFCKGKKGLSGVCVYKLDKDVINIFKIREYPNDNIFIKNILLSEIRKVQNKYNINKVIINDISDILMYENDYEGKIIEKKYVCSKKIEKDKKVIIKLR